MFSIRLSTFFEITLLTLIGGWLLVACATITTGSHYDESANFANYRTFSWASDNPYVVSDSSIRISPLTEQKIQVAIREELARAGYAYNADPDGGDMLVTFTVGTREKIRVESYPVDYPGTWGWHVHGSHYIVREISEHQYTEGTLGVDIFDGETHKPIWHGWAETRISKRDRQNPAQIIGDGVIKLFATFPQ